MNNQSNHSQLLEQASQTIAEMFEDDEFAAQMGRPIPDEQDRAACVHGVPAGYGCVECASREVEDYSMYAENSGSIFGF